MIVTEFPLGRDRFDKGSLMCRHYRRIDRPVKGKMGCELHRTKNDIGTLLPLESDLVEESR